VPLYVFRTDDGREFEELFPSWRDVPQEIVVDGDVARRAPTVAAFHFANPVIAAKAREGLIPYESGMREDAQRRKREKREKQDRARQTFIADQLAQVAL
jgi:hypothetical protein